jgi:hypothetical protein
MRHAKARPFKARLPVGLPVWVKPDCQTVCLIGNGRSGFMPTGRLGEVPGAVGVASRKGPLAFRVTCLSLSDRPGALDADRDR